MSETVTFDRKAFRKGVDDVLTLAPLRDAVRNLIRTNDGDRDKPAGASSHSSKTPTNGRNVTRKAG